MQKLFSYGTLQQTQVQLDTFGRQLSGTKDSLPGYQVGEVKIEDPDVVRSSGKVYHPILRYTGNLDDRVEGTVFELTDAELVQADSYEVDAYQRQQATTSSAVQCWIYAAADEKAPAFHDSGRE